MTVAAVVSYANLIDAATAVLTLPFDVAESDHPIANLKLRGLGDFMQIVTPTGAIVVQVDFGSVKTFNLIGAMGLGMESPHGAGEIELEYQTSVDGVTWGAYEGTVVSSDYAQMFLAGSIFYVKPAGITTRYLRVAVSWTHATGIDRFARLWVDNALILTDRVEDSPEFGFVDPGELSETDGQQYVETRKLRTKRTPFTFRGLTHMQAWGFDSDDITAANVPSINGMQFAAGTTGEVVLLPMVTLADGPPTIYDLWQRRTGIYGHVVSPYSITRDINAESWRTSLTVQEER